MTFDEWFEKWLGVPGQEIHEPLGRAGDILGELMRAMASEGWNAAIEAVEKDLETYEDCFLKTAVKPRSILLRGVRQLKVSTSDDDKTADNSPNG